MVNSVDQFSGDMEGVVQLVRLVRLDVECMPTSTAPSTASVGSAARLDGAFAAQANLASCWLGLDIGELLNQVQTEIQGKRKGLTDTSLAAAGQNVDRLGNWEAAGLFDEQQMAHARMKLLLAELMDQMSARKQVPQILSTEYVQKEVLVGLLVVICRCPDIFDARTIVRALGNLQIIQALAPGIACNHQDAIPELTTALIQKIAKTASDSTQRKYLLEALRRVALSGQPGAALCVRDGLLSATAEPALVLHLTLETIKDLPEVLCSSLSERGWLWRYIGSASSHGAAKLTVDTLTGWLTSSCCPVHPCVLLQLVCALAGLAGIQLEQKHAAAVIALVERGAANGRLVQLGLVWLLVSCGLLESMGSEVLQQFVCNLSSGNAEARQHCAVLGTLLHQEGATSLVVQLVHETLKFGARIEHKSVKQLSDLLLISQLSAANTAQLVLGLTPWKPAAPAVSAAMLCVRRLLSTPLLLKTVEGSKVQLWILQLLENSSQWSTDRSIVHQSLYTELIKLSDEYVAVSTKATSQAAARLLPLPQAGLEKVLLEGETVAQLLALYYVFAHDTACKALMAQRGASDSVPSGFPARWLDQLPTKQLLNRARTDTRYEVFVGPLTALVVSHSPALFGVSTLLTEAEREASGGALLPSALFNRPQGGATGSAADVQAALATKDGDTVANAMLQLSSWTPMQQAPMAAAVLAAAITVDVQGPRMVQDQRTRILFRDVWASIATVCPIELAVLTISFIQPSSNPVSHSELVEQPLQICGCCYSARGCPELLQCLVDVLLLYLNSSKAQLGATALSSTPHDKQTEAQSASSRASALPELLLAQDSAAVQMLLECCLHTTDAVAVLEAKAVQQQAFVIICEAVHTLFVQQPILIKLVCFQGFDLDLVPLAIRGIPSMHLALDCLLELLAQPSPGQKLFAVVLAAELCTKYPLPKSLEIAVQITPLVAQINPTSSLAVHLPQLVSALTQLCAAFPSLIVAAVAALQAVRHTFGKAPDRTAPDNCSPAQLEQVILEAFDKIVTRLNP